MVTIYCLIDPRDGRVRYVGRTTQSLVRRLQGHCDSATRYRSQTPLTRWLRELLAAGQSPRIRSLAVVSDVLADQAERETIARYPDLLNVTHNLAAVAGAPMRVADVPR